MVVAVLERERPNIKSAGKKNIERIPERFKQMKIKSLNVQKIHAMQPIRILWMKSNAQIVPISNFFLFTAH